MLAATSFAASAQSIDSPTESSVRSVSATAQQQPGQTAQPESGQRSDDQEAEKPSLLTPLKHEVEAAPYEPINGRQRMRWFVTNTIGPAHLLGGVFSTGIGTWADRPKEYGTSWDGFGKRYGIRLSGVSVSNAMEASVGTLWGEDPRYFAVPEMTFRQRLRNVVKQTVLARRRDGDYHPAYARFIAISANNFLSNTWRADSESNVDDAIIRTGEGFAGRMAANAFEEFWPTIKADVFHSRH